MVGEEVTILNWVGFFRKPIHLNGSKLPWLKMGKPPFCGRKSTISWDRIHSDEADDGSYYMTTIGHQAELYNWSLILGNPVLNNHVQWASVRSLLFP